MCVTSAKLIQVNFRYLLKKLDPCNGLLNQLHEECLMSGHEVECIERIPTTVGKNEQLLLLILRHHVSTSFWKALGALNQNFIVTEGK